MHFEDYVYIPQLDTRNVGQLLSFERDLILFSGGNLFFSRRKDYALGSEKEPGLETIPFTRTPATTRILDERSLWNSYRLEREIAYKEPAFQGKFISGTAFHLYKDYFQRFRPPDSSFSVSYFQAAMEKKKEVELHSRT